MKRDMVFLYRKKIRPLFFLLFFLIFSSSYAEDTTAVFTIAAQWGNNNWGPNICLQSGSLSTTVKIYINPGFSINPGGAQYNFYVYLDGGLSPVKKTDQFQFDVSNVKDGSVVKVIVADPSDVAKKYGEQSLTFSVTSHPNYTLSAPLTNVCLSSTGSGSYDLILSPYKPGLTYEFYKANGTNINDTAKFIDRGNGTFTRFLKNAPAFSNHYTVYVTDNGCKSTQVASPQITFKLGASDLEETITTNTIYMSSPNTINLKDLFGTIPNGTSIKFSRVVNNNNYNYIKDESVFDPEDLPEGNYTDSIKYEIINSCGNINGTLKSTITIINDKESLPSFLRSTKELPICKNAESFQLTALIRSECVDRPLVDIFLPPFFDIKGWRPTITISDGVTSKTLTRDEIEYKGDDVFTNTSQFVFNIEPYKYSGNSVNINISTPCETGRLLDDGVTIVSVEYNATLKLTPPRVASISGLPTPKSGITYFCSSSADTVSMRGIPSGDPGSYIVEKGIEENGVYKFVKLGDYRSIRYFGYTGTPGDPTLEKFVPSDIFKRLISEDYDSLIRITYWSPKPCSDSVKAIIKFTRPIGVTVSFPKDTICYGDELRLKVNGSKDPLSSFSWSFGDGMTLSFLSDTIVNYTYKNPGKYLLRFQTHINLLSDTLCDNDIVDSIFVGAKPTSSFDIYNNYFGESIRLESSSKILVPNTPEAKDTIVAWNWKFSGGLTDLQGDTVSLGSPGVERDPYQVLHIATASWGCSDTAILSMPIFPVHSVSPDDFDKEQFNTSSKNGWYHTGQYYKDETKSSWRNVPPNGAHIKAVSAGDAAWFTSVSGKGGYNADENSWVESPVYEIGNLQLPMLSMDTWTDMNYPFDGVAVQFAFVDTTAFGKEKWQTLGEMDGEGLNWYNFNSVSGKPGNEGHGWTDNKSGKWSLSAYRLDTILKLSAEDPENRKRVRFRIVLGTTTIGQNMDGFAFDNFFVGQRNRKIIVEEFCDHKNEFDKPEAIFIDPQALRIQYHLSDLTTEEEDEINSQNPYEPSARGLLYGIGKTLPRVVLDGIFYNNDDPYDITKINDYNREYTSWINTSLLERSLITSPYNIKLNSTNNGDSLKIEATIEKSSTVMEDKNYVVQVAIVEKVVQGNGKEFTNVLRQMVPNSAGHRIDRNFVWVTTPTSETTTINASWKPTIKPTSDIYVIAFLQDEDTKEIYQSDYLPVALADYQNLYSGARPGSTSAKASFSDLTLSPNPTAHDLMVRFDGVLKDDYTWSIIDVLGNQRNTGLMLYGTEAKILNTEQLGTGMYYLKLEGEGRSFIKKFSVVK